MGTASTAGDSIAAAATPASDASCATTAVSFLAVAAGLAAAVVAAEAAAKAKAVAKAERATEGATALGAGPAAAFSATATAR